MSEVTVAIPYTDFRKQLLRLLDETFDHVHGAYLDPGDSFFPTLDGITAAQASRVVGTCGNSIAGQVAHVIFYMDVAIKYMRGDNPGRQDWSVAWRTVEVDEGQWDDLRRQLRERQEAIVGMIIEEPQMVVSDFVGGAMAFVAHTAYHLGQVRHALCLLGEQP